MAIVVQSLNLSIGSYTNFAGMFLLNFIFYFFLVIFIIGIVIRLFLRYWLRRTFGNNKQNNRQNQANNTYNAPKKKKFINRNDGDYIDYEEVK